MNAERSHAARHAASIPDRIARALGADPSIVDCVLGDLAEEYAQRAACGGIGAARWWYAREALLSTPHLIRSAIRHGGPRAWARLAAIGTALALIVTVAIVVIVTRAGPPARLVADGAREAEGIVINNVEPVQLSVRALDAAGRVLKVDSVRYAWESGARALVSQDGAVICTERGDATVRASLGPIATRLSVWCRPVREIQASTWISLIAGGGERRLPFKAIGLDDRVVTQLRGTMAEVDSSVAEVIGTTIRPRAAGETAVRVEVGDVGSRIRVLVHEPVKSLAGLRADQRLVAVPVLLAQGDTITVPLPTGVFWLKYLPRRVGDAPPTITLGVMGVCGAGDALRTYQVPLEEYGTTYCITELPGSAVTLAHGAVGAAVVDGWLALERVEHP